jgi:hypothetical protein
MQHFGVIVFLKLVVPCLPLGGASNITCLNTLCVKRKKRKKKIKWTFEYFSQLKKSIIILLS